MVHLGEAKSTIPAPNPGLSGSTNPAAETPLGGTVVATGPAQNPAGTAQQPWQPHNWASATSARQHGQLGSLTTSNIGNGQTVGGGQIIGVASVNKGQGIKEFNDKDHYNDWFFVYDLRLEQSGGTGVAVARLTSADSARIRGATGATGATGTQNPSGVRTPGSLRRPERPRPAPTRPQLKAKAPSFADEA